MSRTPDERNSLVKRINRLAFQEYRRVRWLKAATIADLLVTARYASGACHEEAVERYARAESINDALRRAVMAAFLDEWLGHDTPESMGGWGSADHFAPCDRLEALRQIDQIIEATLADPEAAIGKCLDWLEPDDEHDAGTVPYSQLRAWFAEELFDPASAAYYTYAPLQRSDPHCPRVIGMDRRVIAMFWLE